MNKRESILEYIVEELSKNKDLFDLIDKSTTSTDGRNKSMEGGDIVTDCVMKIDLTELIIPGDKIIKAPDRWWYDMGNEDFPINGKLTEGKGSDNTSSKEGLYYALTGHSPELLHNNRWNTYWEALDFGINHPSEDLNDKDYYFLIGNKKDKDWYWTSLRQLHKLGTPNGSNLPFQVPWDDNRERHSRTIQDAREFLMSNFKKALVKRCDALYEYEKHTWPW